jgi:hypothetical protein
MGDLYDIGGYDFGIFSSGNYKVLSHFLVADNGRLSIHCLASTHPKYLPGPLLLSNRVSLFDLINELRLMVAKKAS